MTDERMGRLTDDGGVEYVRRLRHPPEKVWRALTESEHLVHWFPADVQVVGEPVPGAKLELPFWPAQVERWRIEETVTYGELLTWDPPRLWEWTWDADRLRWELAPDGEGGTVLRFTTWLGDMSPDGLANAGAGYHLCLDELEELLASGSVGYLGDETIRAMEQRYRALAG
jgi:uncharacterized protein YndB with AHSA1/START domain